MSHSARRCFFRSYKVTLYSCLRKTDGKEGTEEERTSSKETKQGKEIKKVKKYVGRRKDKVRLTEPNDERKNL